MRQMQGQVRPWTFERLEFLISTRPNFRNPWQQVSMAEELNITRATVDPSGVATLILYPVPVDPIV